MRFIKVIIIIAILLLFGCFNKKQTEEDLELIPYEIMYKRPVIIEKDTFYEGIVMFKKEYFKSDKKYMQPAQSFVNICIQNNLIYAENYLPRVSRKTPLDTITELNSFMKNRDSLGLYIGKIDMRQEGKNWKKVISVKKFIFSKNIQVVSVGN